MVNECECNADEGHPCDAGEDGEPCDKCQSWFDSLEAECRAEAPAREAAMTYEDDMRGAGRGHLLASSWEE